MNKVILMGRLTADPELKQTNNGTNVCRFTVAVDRRVAQGQERQADFISAVAWNQNAEFVSKYFSKGKMIAVEGSLRTGSYDDKRYPDVKHYTTEVWVDRTYFTGDKATGDSSAQGNYQANSNQYSTPSPQQYAPAANNNNSSLSVGDFGDFEEVIGDSDLPF